MIKFLSLGLPSIKTDFSKWNIFFCDERVVPYDSPDSTVGLYKKELIGKLPGLSDKNFVAIKQGCSGKFRLILRSKDLRHNNK